MEYWWFCQLERCLWSDEMSSTLKPLLHTKSNIYLFIIIFCVWLKSAIAAYSTLLSLSLTQSSLAHSWKWIKLRDLFFMCTWLVSSYLFLATRDIFFYQMQFLEIHTDFVRETNDFCRFYRFSLILWRILQLYLIYKLLLYRLLCLFEMFEVDIPLIWKKFFWSSKYGKNIFFWISFLKKYVTKK